MTAGDELLLDSTPPTGTDPTPKPYGLADSTCGCGAIGALVTEAQEGQWGANERVTFIATFYRCAGCGEMWFAPGQTSEYRSALAAATITALRTRAESAETREAALRAQLDERQRAIDAFAEICGVIQCMGATFDPCCIPHHRTLELQNDSA